MERIKTFDAKIAQLKSAFHPMILANLQRAKRIDLIAGYTTSVLDEYDRKFGVRGYQMETLKNGKISISKTFRMNDSDNDRMHYQNFTEESIIMTNAYNKYVIEGGNAPDLEWRRKIRPFISQEYFDEVAKLEKAVLASKNPWDMCVVASNIPYSNIEKLENAVIKQKRPLAVLEFASSVGGADLNKLRKAISTMEDPETLVSGEEVNYLTIFDDRFGFSGAVNDEQYQPE